MVLFAKDKGIFRTICWPPLVAVHGVGVGIIEIAILVFIALVLIF